MLSKNKIKQILSLARKKERDETLLFVAEGNKTVTDLLPLFRCQTLVVTEKFRETLPGFQAEEIIIATKEEIKKASQLNTPQSALAVFYQQEYTLDVTSLKDKLSIMLDTIQDPGNLGTIIRIADWFGIEEVICSSETVDVYNPKTIQATMGAVGRVRVHYCDLCNLLDEIPGVPLFGTFLQGKNIFCDYLPPNGILLMGNEGNGISPQLESRVTEKLFIPNFPIGRKTSESLNVAVATAIACSEFRRRV
ncbi:MAG: RNA methyltransferase [Prevotellaceae bacterium]|jgi:TrmH family RNA methyltransferase|nr:RNA methyltransferase [Prevotellaceae bacterium]